MTTLPDWLRRFVGIPSIVAADLAPEELEVQRGELVVGAGVVHVDGVQTRTWIDHEDVAHFHGQRRAATDVSELFVHESVTTSRASTEKVLKRRGLGVHLMVEADGMVTQHGDLGSTRLAHAGGHNGPSIGLEIVNPYYPKHRPRRGPWQTVIAAPWAHGGKYVVPTRAQAEAAAMVIAGLTEDRPIGLRIPREWVGYNARRGQRLRMGLLRNGGERQPGIWAHHYSAHADGCWPVLYAWLRLEAGLDPADAYDEAVRRATGVRGYVDLSDLTRGRG